MSNESQGKEGVKLRCKNCGHEWVYTGQQEPYCSCPNCLYKVNIEKRQVDKLEEDEEED